MPISFTPSAGVASPAGGEEFDAGYLNIIGAAPGTANISCNVLIVFNANGSITTTNPNGNGFYDAGGDDNVVGIINNTGGALTSINLSSATFDIFGFDQDGICGYPTSAFVSPGPSCGASGGSTATNNYLPPGVTDTTTSNFAGTIFFGNGGIGANGGTGFFSLEGPVADNLVVTAGTPEPGSLLLMGTGIAGFAGLLRRKFNK